MEETFPYICEKLKDPKKEDLVLMKKYKTVYVQYNDDHKKILENMDGEDKESLINFLQEIRKLMPTSGEVLKELIKNMNDPNVREKVKDIFEQILEKIRQIGVIVSKTKKDDQPKEEEPKETKEEKPKEEEPKEEKPEEEAPKEETKTEEKPNEEKPKEEKPEEVKTEEKPKKENIIEKEDFNPRSRTSTRTLTSSMLSNQLLSVRKQTLGTKIERPVKLTEKELEERENILSGKVKMDWAEEKGEPDLIKIENLSVESLLENVKIRYEAEKYYVRKKKEIYFIHINSLSIFFIFI
jgi:hypothetical protein